MHIDQIVPDPEILIAMEPEDIGFVLLKHFEQANPKAKLHRGNFFLSKPAQKYEARYQRQINEALTSGWVWLEREGFLLPSPDSPDSEWKFVSARGLAVLQPDKFASYKYAANFPSGKLHPSISGSTFSHFMKREYDTAVFAAFRAVEVAVRSAADLPDSAVGVDLMRQAFRPGTGRLTDILTHLGEQEAIMHFFAGAIGSFKNPASHRANTVKSTNDAVSLVQLADFMLRIVDVRKSPGSYNAE